MLRHGQGDLCIRKVASEGGSGERILGDEAFRESTVDLDSKFFKGAVGELLRLAVTLSTSRTERIFCTPCRGRVSM